MTLMASVEPRQSVAIVGTGMAGLITAYMLRNDSRGRFDVEVFEKVGGLDEQGVFLCLFS